MKYKFSSVSAEAIPYGLTPSSVQEFLHQTACKTSIALRIVQPQSEPESKPTSSLAPDIVSQAQTRPSPTLEVIPSVAPQMPLKPESKPTSSSSPDIVPQAKARPSPTLEVIPSVAPQMPLKPESKPTSSSSPDIVPQAKARPSSTLSELKPSVVPTVESSAVEATKARARALYGKEPGFIGVTDRIMTTRDGQRFLYINIKGDGNCGFYAIGVDRSTFVKTIEDLVNEQHGSFQAFASDRSLLVHDIEHLIPSGDMTDIAARVQAIDKLADNGGDLASALKLFTDFATEKQKYHAELFLDALKSLIKNLQDLEGLSNVKSNSVLSTKISELISALASASVDVKVEALINDHDALVASLTKAGVNVKKIQDAFAELMVVFGYGDVELFEKAKLQLSSKIQNLTALSSYEAFLTALREELMKSGVKAVELTTKDKILAGVSTV